MPRDLREELLTHLTNPIIIPKPLSSYFTLGQWFSRGGRGEDLDKGQWQCLTVTSPPRA